MNKVIRKFFFPILLFFLLISMLLSIAIGPVRISFFQILQILIDFFGLSNYYLDDSYNQIHKSVLLNIRLPRVFLGLVIGAALGISGAMLQGLFRNPLVDPGFIGVSSGAAIGAMLIIMFSDMLFINLSERLLPYLLPIFAMSGSIFTTMLVYKMSTSRQHTSIMTMLLSGIAINAFVGSIIGILVINSSDIELRSFTFWTLGGLDGASWEVVMISFCLLSAPIYLTYLNRRKLDIFMLGDAEAGYLGIDVQHLKRVIILFAAAMVGVSVSFCGMIGFVGLVTPHLVRLFIGPKHNFLLIGSALLGSIILIFSDFVSRIIISPAQLPISIVTSLIGAPFFIYLIMEQKRKMQIA